MVQFSHKETRSEKMRKDVLEGVSLHFYLPLDSTQENMHIQTDSPLS